MKNTKAVNRSRGDNTMVKGRTTKKEKPCKHNGSDLQNNAQKIKIAQHEPH